MLDQAQRGVTALQLAELLRILVGDSKPGGYSNTWEWTFCQAQVLNGQQCANAWLNYITSFGSRDRFILRVLHSADVHNNTFWLRYFLMEYECSLAGNAAARRQPGWQIEHFFPGKPGFNPVNAGFSSDLDYSRNFIEQVANKLILDNQLNEAIKDLDPLVKLPAYLNQAYVNVHMLPQNHSRSAIEIANDLAGVASLDAIRLYVKLRAVRLAAFAAKRF